MFALDLAWTPLQLVEGLSTSSGIELEQESENNDRGRFSSITILLCGVHIWSQWALYHYNDPILFCIYISEWVD